VATQELTGALIGVDHGDASPLPPAADAALTRLDRAFSGQSVADRLAHEAGSYVRRTPAVERVAELTMRDRLTPAQYNHLADAQAELNRLHEQLEQAGQLHLVVA